MQASDGTAKIFNEKPEIVYIRPRNLRDSLVRSRVRMGDIGDKGMRKCGKSRCQICNFVEEGSSFGDGRGHMCYFFHHWFSFYCSLKVDIKRIHLQAPDNYLKSRRRLLNISRGERG